MPHSLDEKIKEIKRSFRSHMNGVTAQSMRQKGVDYHLNWGVQLPQLSKMAEELGKDEALATALWKENVRECKILAIMTMPVEKMQNDMVELWMEQMPSQEMVEIAVMQLFQHLDSAPVFAYEWMAHEAPLYQIAGYNLIARLFVKGQEPNERGINEYLDQVASALNEDNMAVKHAAMNSLNRFCMLGDEYLMIAQKALPELSL